MLPPNSSGTKTKDICGRSAARGGAVRGAQAEGSGGHLRDRRHVKDGGVVKGQRKPNIVPDDASEPREYALPRGVHVNVHEGERVRAG